MVKIMVEYKCGCIQEEYWYKFDHRILKDCLTRDCEVCSENK